MTKAISPLAASPPRSYKTGLPRISRCRSVAQSGSAPRSGRGGRRFKSCHSDHFIPGGNTVNAGPTRYLSLLGTSKTLLKHRDRTRNQSALAIRYYIINLDFSMQHADPRNSDTYWHEDPELKLFRSMFTSCAPYLFRAGRAFSYAMASYLLLWLQPHFTFSFSAFGLAIFLLAVVKRSLPVAEVAVLLIAVSVFIPPRLLQTLISLF